MKQNVWIIWSWGTAYINTIYGLYQIPKNLKNSVFWNNVISRIRLKGFSTILNKSVTKLLKIKGNLRQIIGASVLNHGKKEFNLLRQHMECSSTLKKMLHLHGI